MWYFNIEIFPGIESPNMRIFMMKSDVLRIPVYIETGPWLQKDFVDLQVNVKSINEMRF